MVYRAIFYGVKVDWFLYLLFFLAGGLLSHIIFYVGPGPFEQTLWAGLNQGKKVIVCIDEDAFMFEMYGNRLRITRATTKIEEISDVDYLDTERHAESTDSSNNDL